MKIKTKKMKSRHSTGNILVKKIIFIIFTDFKNVATKYWYKFINNPAGAAFVNMHFYSRRSGLIVYNDKLTIETVNNYNLFWFLIYTYLVGIAGLTWVIFIPTLTNVVLIFIDYVLSVSKRLASRTW